MTPLDLLAGHWTWWQLFRDVAPLAFVGVSAFYAGYWRGRVVEQCFWSKRIENLEIEIRGRRG